ncbi:MAG: hypothetical protein DCC65_13025 [Planctomycetota bacterium]|nr:MAG: hypothetical protein DCC65_13025 [Planctomycetota bacterium]
MARILLPLGLVATLASGCSQAMPDRAERMTRGYIFYCDGAGGGGLFSNWAGGVRNGLLNAGYEGAGEMFPWETGFGVFADQTATVEYKKQKGRQLAQKIVEYQSEHPGAPVHLMGLSAGTAVVAYALEALPPQTMIQNVIMLSGSLSSTHDLTEALRHVSGRMYIFTSQRDEVLLVAVPVAGTADRTSAAAGTIGVNGARLPAGASGETRSQYRKISVIPWNPQFARYGHFGGHTDSVKTPFVQQFVAPLVAAAPARTSVARVSGDEQQVENPDYRRWARFEPGAWVIFDGYLQDGRRKTPARVRATLVRKSPDRLMIQREAEGDRGEEDVLTKTFYVTRLIDPQSHPLTHPGARRTNLGEKEIRIRDRTLHCKAEKVEVDGEFDIWGANIRAGVSVSPEIPGGIAQLNLATTLNGRNVRIVGQAVEFGIESR